MSDDMKIHIMGAAGSGTTTLGEALGSVLPYQHLDTDDYFWEEKYTKQRPVDARRQMLEGDFSIFNHLILSGAICGWGDSFKHHFDLIIFLWIPEDVRLERLGEREIERYGDAILEGGPQYQQSKNFLQWASLYDHAGLDVRSRRQQEHWLQDVTCPILRIEGDYSVSERVQIVLDCLQGKMEESNR